MPSSRLCVKNVPKYADEKRVRAFFSSNGCHVTDAKVLKTSSGISRQIAFVGFKTESDSEKALKYFDKAFFDTCKMAVSFALPYGDKRIGKTWSKHAKVLPEPEKRPREDDQTGDESKPKKEKRDQKLAEFLSIMQPRNQSQFWSNDDGFKKPGEESDSEDEEKPAVDKAPITAPPARTNVDGKVAPPMEIAAESGRLFIRNLSYETTEDDLNLYFAVFGPVSEVHIPLDETKRSRGFGYVLFMVPEHAVRALPETDGHIFQGRLLHVMPALSREANGEQGSDSKSTKMSAYKNKKESKQKETAGDSTSWNSLFIRSDAAVGAVADELGISKRDLIMADEDEDRGPSEAVRVALTETRVINETKKFLQEQGVDVDALEKSIRDPSSVSRSKTCFLVKNLPHQTDIVDLRQMFSKFGDLEKLVLPPSKTMAFVAYFEERDASKAFKGMAYKRYKRVPVYLEWAPEDIITREEIKMNQGEKEDVPEVAQAIEKTEGNLLTDSKTLFIKNLSFETREGALRKHLEQFVKKREITAVSIPRKSTTSNVDLSMGFGFVELTDASACRNILRKANGSMLDGHELSMKQSERPKGTTTLNENKRKTSSNKASETLTKIVIRNLAFEATKKDIKQLAASYGQVNSVRLPKKFDGSHRGFAFVDFVTHQEAKDAFAALTNSHLYGRHLVIEWANPTETVPSI